MIRQRLVVFAANASSASNARDQSILLNTKIKHLSAFAPFPIVFEFRRRLPSPRHSSISGHASEGFRPA
jgi:hypothetical protein